VNRIVLSLSLFVIVTVAGFAGCAGFSGRVNEEFVPNTSAYPGKILLGDIVGFMSRESGQAVIFDSSAEELKKLEVKKDIARMNILALAKLLPEGYQLAVNTADQTVVIRKKTEKSAAAVQTTEAAAASDKATGEAKEEKPAEVSQLTPEQRLDRLEAMADQILQLLDQRDQAAQAKKSPQKK